MSQSELTQMLKQCVANGRCDFMTYGQFGQRFGLSSYAPAWANRRTLDVAARECRNDPATHNLDLTFLIRNARTKYPSVIDGKPFDKANPSRQIDRVRAVAQEIINQFAPGTLNPY